MIVIKTLANTARFSEFVSRLKILSSAWRDADCRYPAALLSITISTHLRKSRQYQRNNEPSRVESRESKDQSCATRDSSALSFSLRDTGWRIIAACFYLWRTFRDGKRLCRQSRGYSMTSFSRGQSCNDRWTGPSLSRLKHSRVITQLITRYGSTSLRIARFYI